jgi:indolepyruvate ferredoxin oxidoreductase
MTLEDKYVLESGCALLNGFQALVRLPLNQRKRDLAAGRNTAGFISGYRGSPLGGYDLALWRAQRHLEEHCIRFQPGVNEELAATSIWGTQQLNLFPGGRHDGVFALWYGKGPGVDRSGDAFKHGNMAGAAAHGGVLVVAGDDHIGASSTLPHQSEPMLIGAQIPVLNPSGVQDYLDFGILGWALSRYSGCWVGLKATADSVESTAQVDVDPFRIVINTPRDFELPADGLNIRWPDPWVEQEARLVRHKLPAVLAFARANGIDRIALDSPKPRLGIACAGKVYLDVRQALQALGIDDRLAAEIGVRVYKIGMTWPLEPEGVRRFAAGLDEVLVVEEKRPIIETQLKEQLYAWPAERRPRIVGKFAEASIWAVGSSTPLLPLEGELSPAAIAKVIASRLQPYYRSAQMAERVAALEAREAAVEREVAAPLRPAYFCSGCPHNTSTKLPEGSRGLAGIGCHFMSQKMDRGVETFTQMGAEGTTWIGQAPFTDTPHVFVNIGDGTYFHSGLLAIRAAVSARARMTYKILFNDAVAMTGGQPMDGPLSVERITQQIAAEGVTPVVVVTDEPEKYAGAVGLAPGTSVRHREDLDAVQHELRAQPGVSAIVYDQTCAAEKRRRRKRGAYPDPQRRVFINEAVCEGCGDCGTESNCVSILPVETEFGRKRAIDQSACNKDYSCLNGFCPSFVTIEGDARLRKRTVPADAIDAGTLPEVARADLGEPFNILITGIGGTGVITLGALIATAAHLDGLSTLALDMTGMAQKGGAVTSHVRIAASPQNLHAPRVATCDADLVLGCDMLVAGAAEALSKMRRGRTLAVVNSFVAMTGDFTRDPDLNLPQAAMQESIRTACGEGRTEFVDAGGLATALLGDSIAANMFLLGYAWQKGAVPVSVAALERAIELNGAAVESNVTSLRLGRRAAIDLAEVTRLAFPPQELPASRRMAADFDAVLARRVEYLTSYQDARFGERYRLLVERVRAAERQVAEGDRLAIAVARNYFKLLACKDEYEVARLYTNGEFAERLQQTFEGDYRVVFHFAPTWLAGHGQGSARPRKRAFGPWMLRALRLLARGKVLRGSLLDPFRYGPERRDERDWIAAYERTIDELLASLRGANHTIAVRIAAVPESIRGFGHVRLRNSAAARNALAALLAEFRTLAPAQV